ncbi:MAG: septum formation initiator family protein [Candidatus Dadabacteria bacterium]|nr:MAG: septum formation initiator family protein [Candidatus Dadabacteria bacterium]
MERLIFRVILILAVVSFLVYLFAREISQVYALHKENDKVILEGKELEMANNELRKKIELIKTDRVFMEKIIREELGMIKTGEKIYRFKE